MVDRRCAAFDGDVEPHAKDYYDLMKFRVSEILLVSSLYDAFILREDGLLSEQLLGEYRDLELTSPPRITRVSSAQEAFDELGAMQYDLIITMTRVGEMDPFEFGRRAKGLQPGIPVVLLVTEPGDVGAFHKPGVASGVDKVFFWNGDSTLFLAITKFVEDRMNVIADTARGLVKVIVLVEDSPRYYSVLLPLVYTEIMRQKRALTAEGLNDYERYLRRKARPKILMAETYEEADDILRAYGDCLLGLMTDVRFPKGGAEVADAGFQLAESIGKGVPVLMQSSEARHRARAQRLGAAFVDKGSETLADDVRSFFTRSLGFGDFAFMLPDGKEVGRAKDMREFEAAVLKVPAESIKYHGERNHFSNWLMARGEVTLARRLRPKRTSDFKDDDELRIYLADAFREARREKRTGVIIDFGDQDFEFDGTFTRFGGGSLGGKGRGLAFLSALIHRSGMGAGVKGCPIKVPDTLVIGTEEFDRFMALNGCGKRLRKGMADDAIARTFLGCELSKELQRALRRYIENVQHPIAVRSSSLLEDSQNQPFAGIYSTYILPNSGDRRERFRQLTQAVKLVYASAFYRAAKAYVHSSLQKSEEEKMAVVIQRLVGNEHGSLYYPLFSGVAQSYNFYAIPPLRREDGIASLAMGLGKTVVEGGRVLTFSPRAPEVIPGFASTEEAVKNSQRHFYALDMSCRDFRLWERDDCTLAHKDVAAAQDHGTLDHLVSVYDANDGRLRDDPSSPGTKVVTFAGILKYGYMPLPEILQECLRLGEEGMGRPVELEFAVALDSASRPEFHLLQIRPLVTMRERRQVEVGDGAGALVYTTRALGNCVVEGLRDVVFVPPEAFDQLRTEEMAREIGEFNDAIGGPYILVAPGRWGTRDRFLGIPVDWSHISNARAIVEAAVEGLHIDPSHGSHFFHNMTALGIPYFTVPANPSEGRVDWKWLGAQHPKAKKLVRHVHLAKPLLVKVDGRTGKGAILRGE